MTGPAMTPLSTLEDLTRHEPYSEMSEGDLRFLLEHLEQVECAKGSVLLEAGAAPADFLWILSSGCVELFAEEQTSTPLGDGRLLPGSSFPLEALATGGPVSTAYRATELSVCYRLRAADFQVLYGRSAALRQFCAGHREAGQGASPMDRSLASAVGGPPHACAPDTPLRATLELMHAAGVEALVVTGVDDAPPAGVFTRDDALAAVVAGGLRQSAPVADLLCRDHPALPSAASTFDGVLALLRSGRRHLLVVDEGRPRGLATLADLLPLSSPALETVADALAAARDSDALRAASRDIFRLADRLLDQGLGAEQLTGLIACLVDLLSCRIIDQVFASAELAGIEYCWLALGSEGRREQTLVTDQDNGLIFAAPGGMHPDRAREILLPLAQRVNQTLDACGIPLCKGGIMAGNPQWCASLDEWKTYFDKWIGHGDPESLLHGTIFFDFRAVCGARGLARELRAWLCSHAQANPRFLHQMAANALRNRPPLGLLRDFTVDGEGEDRDTINLKLNGAGPLVDAARIFSLAVGVEAVNTGQRLREAAPRLQISPMEAQCWIDALHHIQRLRLGEQSARIHDGRVPGNRVNPYALHQLDRHILKESLRQVRQIQARLALDYQL